MKIVQLDIQGFRSLKTVSWRPGDLNVVIGPNGSGKSNLLRMLELISAAMFTNFEDRIYVAGGFAQLVWDGQAKQIVFSLTTSGTGIGIARRGFVYEVSIEQDTSASNILVEQEVLRDSADNFHVIEKHGSSGEIRGREKDHVIKVSEFDTATILSSTTMPTVPWIMQSALPFYRQKISDWKIYQDIHTDQAAPIRQAPISRLEQRVSPDGQNLINVLHTLYSTDRKFKQDINDAMFAAFGADFDELIFPPAADQRIQMRVRWKTLKREQSTADLSDGTLRFLFLITVLASPNPPPLIAIDEPETGLHPSMLPIIAEFAVEAATRTQVIFTTHSDQFLSAFRDTRPTVTVAKWENGETTLTTVEDKELAYWVQDYSLGQLFRSGELENLAS